MVLNGSGPRPGFGETRRNNLHQGSRKELVLKGLSFGGVSPNTKILTCGPGRGRHS